MCVCVCGAHLSRKRPTLHIRSKKKTHAFPIHLILTTKNIGTSMSSLSTFARQTFEGSVKNREKKTPHPIRGYLQSP